MTTPSPNFLEFDILDPQKFKDFLIVYKQVAEASEEALKFSAERNMPTDDFWLAAFPKYAIQQFAFDKEELQPSFSTHPREKGRWYFFSLIQHLTCNLEIEFLPCETINEKTGRLNYYVHAFPYGGTGGLIQWLKSFDCITRLNYEGKTYEILWENELEFIYRELEL